jgi:hypothetical protein
MRSLENETKTDGDTTMRAMKEERRKPLVFNVEGEIYLITDDDEYDRMGLNKDYVESFYNTDKDLSYAISKGKKIPTLKKYGVNTEFFEKDITDQQDFVNLLSLFCDSVPDNFIEIEKDTALAAKEEILLRSFRLDMEKKDRIIMLEKAGFPDFVCRIEESKGKV